MLENLARFTNVTEVNVSRDERWASLAGGATLLVYAMIRIPISAVIAVIAASYLMFRGMRGFCYFYDRMGVNKAVEIPITSESPQSNNYNKRETAVPMQ